MILGRIQRGSSLTFDGNARAFHYIIKWIGDTPLSFPEDEKYREEIKRMAHYFGFTRFEKDYTIYEDRLTYPGDCTLI